MLPRSTLRLVVLVLALPLAASATTDIATSINALGLDLYRQQIKSADGANVLLSPYSISSALAMTYLGADGETKAEMQRVLRLHSEPVACSAAFQSLARDLLAVVTDSEKLVAGQNDEGGTATPIQLTMANRLFPQRGYALRPEFVDQVERYFTSTLEELDFRNDPNNARIVINDWVAVQTHSRIRDLLPAGQPVPDTRLALINVLYLKATWQYAFNPRLTTLESYHLTNGETVFVPTMLSQRDVGYAKQDGYTVIALPYQSGRLQFVLLVPDDLDGLPKLEKTLTAKALNGFADLKSLEVILHLPKFILEPDTMPLAGVLKGLGLMTAFDTPKRSANFDRMAPRNPTDYLYIGEIFHKSWLALDEYGTEAATGMFGLGLKALLEEPEPPIEVRGDRPFLFAIQHVESGTCLFLGRVMDPR